ncbi:MAG: 2OG-Fe(II) oxygenase [Planctomycetota bacterium]
MFTVSEFFTFEECEEHIAMSEDIGFEEALVTSARGAVRAAGLRNNDRVMFKSDEIANWLWQRAEEFVPSEFDGRRFVGINELIRFYRYEVGQEFKWHQDFPYERDNGERSYLTLLIYLNDTFDGGETLFDDSCSEESFDDVAVVPQTGMALFFEHSTYHKGEVVTSGTKYVMRTDVMYSALEDESFADELDFDTDVDDWA